MALMSQRQHKYSHLRDVSLKRKLNVSFLCICFLLLIVGSLGIWGMWQIREQSITIIHSKMSKVMLISEIHTSIVNANDGVNSLIADYDIANAQERLDQIRATERQIAVLYAQYRTYPQSSTEQQVTAQFDYTLQLWMNNLNSIIPGIKTFFTTNNANDLLTSNIPLMKQQSASLEVMLNQLLTIVVQDAANSDQAMLQITEQIIGLVAIILILAILVSWFSGRVITQLVVTPIQAVVAVAQRAAQGELEPIDDLVERFGGRDETGQLIIAFNLMIAGIMQIIDRIHEANQAATTISSELVEIGETNSTANRFYHNQWESVTADLAEVGQITTQLTQAYHTNKLLADMDALTGIANKRTLLQNLELEIAQAKQSGQSLAIIFLDGDRFKSVNDTYGHAVGDAVLCQLAERISEVLRKRDTLGRYGGEEFVVVLPNTTMEGAQAVAERIRAHVAHAPLVTEFVQGGLPVTVSVGVAFYGLDGIEAQEILIKADHAMYLAKRSGRNRVCASFDLQLPPIEYDEQAS